MSEHDPMSQPTPPSLDHAAVDELAGALSLGALEADEARAVSAHLATCDQPHTELRQLLGANAALAGAVEAVTPSPALRERLMATVAVTPQDAAATTSVPAAPALAPRAQREPPPTLATPPAPPARARWWGDLFDPRSAGFARGLAALAIAGVIVLGGLNLSLRSSLDDRQATLDRVASALAAGGPAFAVTAQRPGAGSGYVIEHGGKPLLVASLPPVPSGHLYEMWLIDAAGKPVSAGTITKAGQIAVVNLEVALSGYTTFAITVEEHRVDAPTTTPIIAGMIGT